MRSFSRDAEISDGLDLLLAGLIATIVGGYIRNLSTAPIEVTPATETIAFLHAAAVIPEAIGSFVFMAGLVIAVAGPLFCWIGLPLYRRYG